MSRIYDANNPNDLKDCDDALWRALAARRAYMQGEVPEIKLQGARAPRGTVHGANHGIIWEFAEKHGNPDEMIVTLEIIEKGQGADLRIILADKATKAQIAEQTIAGHEYMEP